MNIFEDYINHLKRSRNISRNTVKNYISDVRRFMEWLSSKNASLDRSTFYLIPMYIEELSTNISKSSIKRHTSSLKNFLSYINNNTQNISNDYNDIDKIFTKKNEDNSDAQIFIDLFKNELKNSYASKLTIKNYILDTKIFINWINEVYDCKDNPNELSKIISNLSIDLINEYIERLKADSELSYSTIQRRKVSLNKYLQTLYKYNKIYTKPLKISGFANNEDHIKKINESDYLKEINSRKIKTPEPSIAFSKIPPIRLYQKMFLYISAVLDILIFNPLSDILIDCQNFLFLISGKNLFKQTKSNEHSGLDQFITKSGIPLYHSLSIHKNIKNPFFSTLVYILLYKRPFWYSKYHQHKISHYLHFAILILVATTMGNFAFSTLDTTRQTSVLGSQVSLDNGRTLSFSGTLLDKNRLPISSRTEAVFSLYNDESSSSSARLWSETRQILPDQNGTFYIKIGSSNPIPDDILRGPDPIFLGVKIGDDLELSPRQQLPNVSMAQTSRDVDGLSPITSTDSTKNVLLALDSAGNLTIGNNSSPIFQAPEGEFAIQGKSLLLSTMKNTDGNILLSPDGLGEIKITRPLENITDYGGLPISVGSVIVKDTFSVLAQDNNKPGIFILQNGSGDIITASNSSGLLFNIDKTGSSYINGNIFINGGEVSTSKFAAGIFNKNTGILNIGGESVAVTIGSHSGTTNIRNSLLSLSGNQTIAGTTGTTYTGNDAGINFAGGGNHSIKAASGNLIVGSTLRLSRDSSILPEQNDGTNDLGSLANPFDTIYANNIVSSSLNSITNLWSLSNNILKPLNTSNNLSTGTNGSVPAWIIYGDGVNKATASSSGGLSFISSSTNINLLNGSDLIFNSSSNGDAGLSSKLILKNTGYLGLGKINPEFILDISDTKIASSVSMITNNSSGSDSDVLSLKINNPSPTSGNSFLTFINGNGEVIGKIQGNGSNGVAFSSSGSDVAEYFKKHDSTEFFENGHLVCLHPEGGVTKCSQAATAIVGVVTDRPGFIGGSMHEGDARYLLVGISGQIPTLVTAENGEVLPSDPLTYSSENGIAAKAISSGYVVGRSLQRSEPNGLSKITVFIQPSFYSDSKIAIERDGDLQITLQSQKRPGNNNNTSSEDLYKIIYGLAEKTVSFTKITADTIISGAEIIAQTISANEILASQKIKSPIVESEIIYTGIISPLSRDEGLSIVFNKNSIDLVSNQKNSESLVSINSDGDTKIKGDLSVSNASISGLTQTRSLSVDQDGTVSGSLRVKRLIADEIISSSSSQQTFITNVTNVYNNSISSSVSSVLHNDNPDLSRLKNNIADSKLNTESKDIDINTSTPFTASNLQIDSLKINSGLMVFGPASFADLSVNENLFVGGNLTLGQSSINTIESSLSFQSLRQANIDFMGGLITIDTNGNLFARGNAIFDKNLTVNKNLFASTIKPIPDQDLQIDLGQEHSQKDSKFIIKNSSESAILQVNKKGDLTSSGSGNFISLLTKQLNLIRGAQADTSITKTVASSSAGTATISKGQKERTIFSPFVTKFSLIYISPTSDTNGLTPYIAKQEPTLLPNEDPDYPDGKIGSFTINVTSPSQKEINLNWWIIN